MAKNKGGREVVWLRFDLHDASKAYINSYLAAAYPEHDKVLAALGALIDRSEKVLINEYNGQKQVTVYIAAIEGTQQYAVSGLGKTVDLAILSCYAKCAFEAGWHFHSDAERDFPSDRPDFS